MTMTKIQCLAIVWVGITWVPDQSWKAIIVPVREENLRESVEANVLGQRETWSSQRTMVALVTGPRGMEARGEDG